MQISEDEIELYVAVADTGRGIRESDMNRLFQSFQQLDSKRNRNVEGTGLGLAISRQLVALMRGKIHVDSEYGKGSTFSFVIPQKVTDSSYAVERWRKILWRRASFRASIRRENLRWIWRSWELLMRGWNPRRIWAG